MDEFRAFLATKRDGEVRRELGTLSHDDLPAGEVTIHVALSSVNYKDALATVPKGGVARTSPLVPGIDLAGEVVSSDAGDVEVGDRVLAHGHEIGTARHGGFAEYARVPADWVVPLPDGLDERGAMALGTAGFTAALSVDLLERHGLRAGAGPVLVTGATGGVGSTAVAILAARGHEVVASTGKQAEHGYLRALGAAEVVSRDETTAESDRPLEAQRWAGAIDPVGGASLAYVLRTLRYGAAVAACGLTGGPRLSTTVLPFILRAVALLGADSVEMDGGRRRELWGRLADDLRPRGLDDQGDGGMVREIGLDELEDALDAILAGRLRGRTVVRVAG